MFVNKNNELQKFTPNSFNQPDIIYLIYPFLNQEDAKELRIATCSRCFHSFATKYLHLTLPRSQENYFSYVNVEKIRFINKIGGELTTMAMKTPLLQCFHETFDLYPELEDLSHLNFYQEINQTELFNNKQLMLAAVRKDGFFLEFASPELQSDPEIVMTAVKQRGWALQYAFHGFRMNYDIVMAAVTQQGWSLQFASNDLKENYDIVMAAVSQYGESLKFASSELQADRRIVIAAVSQMGRILEFTSEQFQSDPEIVAAAVLQNPEALRYASLALQNDVEFLTEISRKNPEILNQLPSFLKLIIRVNLSFEQFSINNEEASSIFSL